jgi:hypothetical protein
MNYYAQGGQPYGLNSLADTDYYSRGVQYKDGVPSFGIGGSLKKAWKGTVGKIEDIAKPITKPITDAVKPILPYVQYIAPFIPGVGPLAAAGLGALGSGFAGGGGFNFKRGLMGGMTAYGISNLYAGLQAAGGAPATGAPTVTGTEIAPVELAAPGAEVTSSGLAAGDAGASVGNVGATGGATGYAGYADPTIGPPSSAMSYADRAANAVSSGVDSLKAGYNTLTDPSTYSNLGDKFATQTGDAGQGIKNLAGLGDTTMSTADAAKAFTGSGATLTNTAGSAFMGYTGGAALDEAEKMKNEADLAAAKDDAERNAILARIEESKQRGIRAMQANPYQFAYGGPVDDEAGLDDWNNYTGGGIASMAKGGMPPRFLSGGGDGMSDDIPATINGKQPARLADGEFVIPADVVSHLGNGSSKAGAKQLYSMMDKVRTARTGNKKQGKEINPAKYMPA